MLKTFRYFVRNYKYDILTAIFGLLLTVVTFIYAQSQKAIFSLSFVIITFSLILIIYIRFREKDFFFISLLDRKQKDDWIGNGIFEYRRTEKSFLITNSDSGYIYSKSLTWNDYKVSFDFKIVKACLGAILRAVNLSNYVLLQIRIDGIRPHIRVSGGWFWVEPKDANLSFDNNLSLDRWYKCILVCEKTSINIKLLDNKKIIFDRGWDIPQGSLFFEFKRDEKDASPAKIPFPITLEYGSIGFRNAGEEKAVLRNLLVEKI